MGPELLAGLPPLICEMATAKGIPPPPTLQGAAPDRQGPQGSEACAADSAEPHGKAQGA